MKLTDEKIWVALGYKKMSKGFPFPKYTTSLDAIVAEIEARGLGVELRGVRGQFYARVGDWGNLHEWEHHPAYATAPPALCAALLRYIAENK